MQKLFFISCFVLVAFAGFSQTPTFTFECFCGTLTAADTTCDICNTSTQSRYFKGLLIRKNGVAFRWIEEPYTVIQNFNALTFRELIPNAEQIRIELSGTQWTTIEGFRDSVQCPCSGGGSVTLIPGPGISIYGDTIAVIPQQIDTFDIVGGDTLRISLDRDSVPFHFVILPPDSDNQNLSYAQSTGIMSISGGTGDTINVMVGATAGTNGERGLVPRPVAGEQGAFLRGDGTWANPSVGGDNWGSQVVQVQPRLTGDGTGSNPLDIAQQGATSGQALKWNGTSWSPANDLDTSGYNLSFSISGDTLYIQDGASTKFANLLQYKDNTDAQTLSIDSVTTADGRRFALSISNGNTIYFEDRDSQQIDTFRVNAGNVELSIQRDAQPVKTIPVTSIAPVQAIAAGTGISLSGTSTVTVTNTGDLSNTNEIQQLDTFALVGNTLRASLLNDGVPFSSVDLSPYLDNTDDQQVDTFRVNAGNVELSIQRDAQPVKTIPVTSIAPVQAIAAGTGISLSGTSTVTVTNTGDLSETNEIQRLDTFALVGNTLRASLLNDGVPFSSVDLSAYANEATNLTYTGASSPVTLNSSTGTDVTHTAGTGISLSATSGNMTITNTAPDQTVTITNGGGVAVSGTYPAFTLTASDPSETNEIQRLDTFALVGNTLRASLLNDGVPFSSVDLSGYLDNTDNQQVDTFRVNAGNVELSIQRDAQPVKTIPVTSIAPVQAIAAGTGISVSGTSTVTVTNTGDLSNTNEIQQIDTFALVGNTLRASLLNDGVPFSSVDLSGYLDNTDNQQVDTFRVNAGNVELSIQRDSQPVKTIPVTSIAPVQAIAAGTGISVSGTSTVTVTNTGDLSETNEIQRLDTFALVGNTLRASLLNDGVPFSSVDLSGYLDNTDNQQVDTFSISGNVVSLSVQRDGEPAKTITLPTADGSETIVSGANGVQVTGNGTSGTPYVVSPPAGSDTQTLRYSGTTLTANSALTNNGAQIGINSAPDASYRLKVKQSTDTDGIAVERSSSTSQLKLYHNSNGVIETSSNNLHFRSAGNVELYGAGGGFITQMSIRTINPITVASGNSGLLRLDATYAPTSAGGDFAFFKNYPEINQTGAANQPIYGFDFNPTLVSLQGELYGVRHSPDRGRFLHQPNGDTVTSHLRGRLGIGNGTTLPARRLHVDGDMRLTGSAGTPTAIMGRAANGDVGSVGLSSGLSIVSGVLTVSDTSSGNELQRLDTFALVGNTLRASLLNDGVPFSSVDLSGYLDNTDNQQVDTFRVNAGNVELSIQRDAQPVKTIPVTSIAPVQAIAAGTGISLSGTSTVTVTNTGDLSNTNEIQRLDTFALVGNTLRASLLNDGVPFSSVDLSAYANEATNLTYTGASSPVTLNSSTGTDVTHTAGTGISLSATSGNMTITNTAPDQTVTITNGGGIAVSGTYPAFTLTANDQSNTNELQRLDTFTIVSNVLRASLLNDGVPFSSVDLSPYLDNTDDQKVDTFALVGNVIRLSLESDSEPFKSVDLSPLLSGGLNGIYGDGTAGTGSDTLPPGGSIVTIPGQNQPLQFNIRPQLPHTNSYTAIEVNTNYSSDDAVVRYFAGTAPADSLEIYNFDNQTWIKETGGNLNLETDRNITLTADSVSATAPTRTIAPFLIGQSSDGYFRKIAGASSGQIMKWNGTNWALAADDTGSGGLTGAENGLSVSGSNARLGGTLLTTTTIAQAGFDLRSNNGKWSHSTNTLFAFTPTQGFGVTGSEGNPTTNSTPTLDGIAELRAHLSNSEQPNSLTIGAYATDNQGMWMQARSQAVPNFSYPLQLNPRGGTVSIGRGTTIPTARFTVTATGATGSTASGMVGLFENTAGSGNVSVGFGTGSDVIGGQLMWNATTDAMRITNRNATNGTSSVRIAVGGETSDVATFEKSAATSLVQFGVGTTTPHSTIQSAGSIATAYLETVGAPTFDETKRTVVYTANTNITWTLPTAAACACAGREYILHHSGTAGTVTLSQSISRGNGGTFNTLTAGQWAYVIYGSSSIRGYKLTSL